MCPRCSGPTPTEEPTVERAFATVKQALATLLDLTNRLATALPGLRQPALAKAPVELLPTGQGWKVGRSRRKVENGAFNLLTHDYALTHNYGHSAAAILGLLVLRAVAYCVTWAYRRFASARSRDAPRDFLRWFHAVLGDDWVRYLDGALTAANPRGG